MLVLARRGYRPEGVAENTLEAIQAAADRGFDGVEIDVRRCGSGDLVLSHDAEAAGLPVREASLGELRHAGVAALSDAAALASRLGLWLDIEAKEPGVAVPALLLAGGRREVMVSSFLPAALREASPFLAPDRLGRLLWPDPSVASMMRTLLPHMGPAGLVLPPWEAWMRLRYAFVPSRTGVWHVPPGEESIAALRDAGVMLAITDHAEHAEHSEAAARLRARRG